MNFPESRVSKKMVGPNKQWDDNCIDFIFYKGDIKVNSVKYLDMVPEGSDHRGLILDFSI